MWSANPAPLLRALLALAALPVHAGPPKVQILGPGVYYRHEVPGDLSGTWMALAKAGNGWAVKPVRVQATPVTMAGDRTGRASGLRVQPQGLEEALLLVKGLPGMTEGPVMAADGEPARQEPIARQRSAGRFEGTPYELWSETLNGGKDYILRLEHAGKAQMLFLDRNCDECSWDLLWAGDLDRDGRLDLLLAASGEDNQGSLRLFVSTQAKEHQRVAPAATHRWTFGD